MAIIQAFLSVLSRRAGKIVNTLFGWATSMLYGKAPPERQIFLSIMSMASVLWMIVVLGILFPRLGVFLVSFAKVPSSASNLVRFIMLGAALFVPIVIGFLSMFMKDPPQRPQTARRRLQSILKGYPFALGLSLSLLFMLFFAPILKIADMIKRWQSEHIQMVVEAKDYQDMVRQIQGILKKGGYDTLATRPTWMLRLPIKIITIFGGGGLNKVVAERLILLRSTDLEVLLLPFDLHLRAKKGLLMRVRALLAKDLTFTKAHLTWSRDAQELEDSLVRLWNDHQTGKLPSYITMEKLNAIEKTLEKAELPFEEWEVLYREKLLLDKKVLRAELMKTPPKTTGHHPGIVEALLQGLRQMAKKGG